MNSEYTIQKEMQACQLRILVDFQKVCAKNNICFYLAFGTCLGAVRHKGFIPWDDDIDLFMRVDEVEKLKEVQDQLPPHLYLQTHEKDPEFGLPIVRIRDSSTTLIEADLCDRDINHGVYIDIYPLFYCNGKENAILVKLAAIESLICRLFTYNAPPSNKSSISTSVSKLLLRLVPDSLKRKIANYLYKDLISHKKTKYVSNFPDISGGRYYRDEWFGVPVMADFEGMKMPLPTNASDYLTYYFKDYMQLPPESDRKVHHQYLFADFHNSYLKYKGIEYCKKS